MATSAQWADLRRLVAEYMTPEMRAAGFEGAGRSSLTFKLAAEDDDLHVVVHVRGWLPRPVLAFHIDSWVTARSRRDYARVRGFRWTPDAIENDLHYEREAVPESLVREVRQWATWEWEVLDTANMAADYARRVAASERAEPIDPGDVFDRYGPQFRSHLSGQVIPKWLSWLDRDVLTQVVAPDAIELRAGAYVKLAYLWVDHAKRDQVARWLTNAEAGAYEFPKEIAFLRERLDAPAT